MTEHVPEILDIIEFPTPHSIFIGTCKLKPLKKNLSTTKALTANFQKLSTKISIYEGI